MKQACKPHCDYGTAMLKGRARWCCAACGRDFSLEYLFYMAATIDADIALATKNGAAAWAGVDE